MDEGACICREKICPTPPSLLGGVGTRASSQNLPHASQPPCPQRVRCAFQLRACVSPRTLAGAPQGNFVDYFGKSLSTEGIADKITKYITGVCMCVKERDRGRRLVCAVLLPLCHVLVSACATSSHVLVSACATSSAAGTARLLGFPWLRGYHWRSLAALDLHVHAHDTICGCESAGISGMSDGKPLAHAPQALPTTLRTARIRWECSQSTNRPWSASQESRSNVTDAPHHKEYRNRGMGQGEGRQVKRCAAARPAAGAGR